MPYVFDTAPASDAVVSRLIRAVVNTPATIEDYQKLGEIVQDAHEHNLGADQVMAQIGGTPFAWLIRILPENKEQAYSFIQMLGTILGVIIAIATMSQKTQASVSLTPDQEKQIIEQLDKHIGESRPVKPTPTGSPTGKPAGCQ
jgi:hypothetical protein